MTCTEITATPTQTTTPGPCPCEPDGHLCPGARMLAPSADELYAAGVHAAREWRDDERRQLFGWLRESR